MIASTHVYAQFQMIVGNRPLNPAHVRNLMRSITQENRLSEHPILVNTHSEVIDGQHRLAAAKNLGVKIYYQVIADAGLPTIQRLQTQRAWSLMNFLDSFCVQGVEDYQVLKAFCTKFSLPVSMGIYLLSSEKEHILDQFRSGGFRVVNLADGYEIVQWVQTLEPFIVKPSHKNMVTSEFVRAIKVLRRKHVKLTDIVHKLTIHQKKIPLQITTKDYLRVFEDILNFQRRGEDIRIF